MSNAKNNRQYKDSVFVDLFLHDKTAKANFISLYNALHNTQIPFETELQNIRLEQVLYMNFYNDVSCIIDNKIIVLAEHQSTINKNMPMRFLEYIARLYEQLQHPKEKYRKRQVKIPTPEFFVFYNGRAEYPKKTILKLSDAFIFEHEKPNLELEVTVLNINSCKHNEILLKCEPIKEYSLFVDIVRRFEAQEKATGFSKAIEYCIKNNILKEYLQRKSKEVLNMLLTEYDYATDIAVQCEEAREEAREEAMVKGISQGAHQNALTTAKKMKQLGATNDFIFQTTGLSLSEVEKL